MNAIQLASLFAISACRSSGPVLLQSPPTQQPPWATVSLTIAGDEADEDKRDSCMEEARNAGIQLAAGAPTTGTLYFLDHDDYLEIPGMPNFVFGAMGSNATCKIALARLTRIDSFVRMTKADPTGCEPTGSVEGTDTGFLLPGSYDAAIIEAQFKVRMQGGNLFVQDAMRQIATRVVVNGRGFRCAR